MLDAVDNSEYEGPVKIGIGPKAHERALFEVGCERVFSPDYLLKTEHDFGDPAVVFFRPGDTVIMLQPGILPMPRMRAIDAVGVHWQVPGHDPVKFGSDDDRFAWRKAKPRGVSFENTPDVLGRPPKWPVPTWEQIQSIVELWHSEAKRSHVVQSAQAIMGADVPSHWVRDLVIKATGSAKRNKDGS